MAATVTIRSLNQSTSATTATLTHSNLTARLASVPSLLEKREPRRAFENLSLALQSLQQTPADFITHFPQFLELSRTLLLCLVEQEDNQGIDRWLTSTLLKDLMTHLKEASYPEQATLFIKTFYPIAQTLESDRFEKAKQNLLYFVHMLARHYAYRAEEIEALNSLGHLFLAIGDREPAERSYRYGYNKACHFFNAALALAEDEEPQLKANLALVERHYLRRFADEGRVRERRATQLLYVERTSDNLERVVNTAELLIEYGRQDEASALYYTATRYARKNTVPNSDAIETRQLYLSQNAAAIKDYLWERNRAILAAIRSTTETLFRFYVDHQGPLPQLPPIPEDFKAILLSLLADEGLIVSVDEVTLQERTFSIHSLQTLHGKLIIKFVEKCFNQAIDLFGSPPAAYALVGLGSLARGEVCIHSDLDAILLVDQENQETVDYFKKVTEFWALLVGNLGETQFFMNNQPYLKDGFCLDPAALSPLHTIGTPKRILAQQEEEVRNIEVFGEMNPIPNALRVPCFMTGDEALYDRYVNELHRFFRHQTTQLSTREQRRLVAHFQAQSDAYIAQTRASPQITSMEETSAQMRECCQALSAADPQRLERQLHLLIALAEHQVFLEFVSSEAPFSENMPFVVLSALSEVMSDRHYIGLPLRQKLLTAKTFNSYSFFLLLFHHTKDLRLESLAKKGLMDAVSTQIGSFNDQIDANKENRHRYELEIQAYFEMSKANLGMISGTHSMTRELLGALVAFAACRDFETGKRLCNFLDRETGSGWTSDCLFIHHLRIQALHDEPALLKLLTYLDEHSNPDWRVSILLVDTLCEIALYGENDSLKRLAFFGTRHEGTDYKGLIYYLHFDRYWFQNNWRVRAKAFRSLVYLMLHSDIAAIQERASQLVSNEEGVEIGRPIGSQPRSHKLGVKLLELVTFPTDLIDRSSFDAKQDLYRSVTLLIDALAVFHNLEVYTTTGRIEVLATNGYITPTMAHLASQALELACTLRTRSQIFSGEEVEEIALNPQPDHQLLTLSYDEFFLLRELHYLFFIPLSQMRLTTGSIEDPSDQAKIAYAQLKMVMLSPCLDLLEGVDTAPPELLANAFLQRGEFNEAVRAFRFTPNEEQGDRRGLVIEHNSFYEHAAEAHEGVLAQPPPIRNFEPLNHFMGCLFYFHFQIGHIQPPPPPPLPDLTPAEEDGLFQLSDTFETNCSLTRRLLFRHLAEIEQFVISERMKRAIWEFRSNHPISQFPIHLNELYAHLFNAAAPVELGDPEVSLLDLYYSDLILLLHQVAEISKALEIDQQQLLFGYIYDYFPKALQPRFFSELARKAIPKVVINALRNFPQPNGLRPMAVNEQIIWHDVSSSIANAAFPEPSVRVEGIHTRANRMDPKIAPLIVKMVRGSRGEFGRHSVAEQNGIFYKENPELPGRYFAVAQLARMLSGDGPPPHDLLHVKLGEHAFVVMASKTVGGANLQHVITKKPELLKQIDPTHFCHQALLYTLVNPEDAKPDNFKIPEVDPTTLTAEGTITTKDVDPDRAFVSPMRSRILRSSKLQVKNIIYCMDQMVEPVTPQFRKEILALNPLALLQHWLKELIKYNRRCLELFGMEQINRLLAQEKLCEIPFFLKPTQRENGVVKSSGLILQLFDKLMKIQNLLKSDPTVTPIMLLHAVEPKLASIYYAQLKLRTKPVIKRFVDLTAGEYKRDRGSTVSMTSTRFPRSFKSWGEYQRHGWTPEHAMQELRFIAASHASIDAVLNDLVNREGVTLRSLNLPDISNAVVRKIHFQTLPGAQQAAILDRITGLTFTELHLAGCSELTDAKLKEILKHSPNLILLDLGRSRGIVNLSFLPEACPNLQRLNLRGIPSLKTLHSNRATETLCFPHLRTLDLSHCSPDLTVRIGLPVLRTLKLNGPVRAPGLHLLPLNGPDLSLGLFHQLECDTLPVGSPLEELLLTTKQIRYKKARFTRLPDFSLEELSDQRSVAVVGEWLLFSSQKAVVTIPDTLAEILEHLNYPHLTLSYQVDNKRVEARLAHQTAIPLDDQMVVTLAENNPALQSVNLSGATAITNSAIETLVTHCEGLNLLNLEGCTELQNEAFELLENHCHKLTSLNLSGCRCGLVRMSGIQNLARNCEKLVSLSLHSVQMLTDEGLELIIQERPTLLFIDVSDCPRLSLGGIQSLATHCKELQGIKLNGCTSLTDDGLADLVSQLPQLESIELGNCENISSAGVIALANHCPNLISLRLSECELVADEAISALASHCPQLEDLDVSGCEALTNHSIDSLRECSRIRRLNLTGCINITNEAIAELRMQCPHLEEVIAIR